MASQSQRRRLRISAATVVVLTVALAAIGLSRSLMDRASAEGRPVSIVLSNPGSSATATASAAASGSASPKAGTPTTAPVRPAPPTSAPVLVGNPGLQGSVQNNNSGGGGSVAAPAPAPAPKTPSTLEVSGVVACASGQSVQGVWISALSGSGYTPWQAVDTGSGAFGSTSKYWYTLPSHESYSLHVGCGGNQTTWAVACYGPVVGGAVNNFNCVDVAGRSGYGTCVQI